MPFGDRTGPEGKGPRTGRGLGYCSGRNAPGYTATEPRRGMGYGRGFRRGYGRGAGFGRRLWLNSQTTAEERKALEAEKKAIEQRLKELEE